MSLHEGYIQAAINQKMELESRGISPADFYALINYDNIRVLLDKMDKLEKEVKYLRGEVSYLRSRR